MSVTADPRFSVWLGDGWPGPYIVTYSLKRRPDTRIVAVTGVRTVAEAVCIADAAHHVPEDEIESVSITVGYAVDASSHLDALTTFRAESEEREREIARRVSRTEEGQ